MSKRCIYECINIWLSENVGSHADNISRSAADPHDNFSRMSQQVDRTAQRRLETQYPNGLAQSRPGDDSRPIINLDQPGKADGSLSRRWPGRYSKERVYHYIASLDEMALSDRDEHYYTAWALSKLDTWDLKYPGNFNNFKNKTLVSFIYIFNLFFNLWDFNINIIYL